MANLEKLDEEFNNFMHRVTEVNSIVKKLGSTDKTMQNIGMLEADKYLKDSSGTILENIDEKSISLKVVSDRTVLNKKALRKVENPDTMSQGRWAVSDWR